MYKRLIRLDKNRERSFFLWGPRQSGKSTLLRENFGDAYWVDLLMSDKLMKYQADPSMLRRELSQLPKSPAWVVIDEVQKVPALLDEVHYMIENTGVKFALCGSSARKVRHGHANLLGGRALKFHLLGLSAAEIGEDANLEFLLNRGFLPFFYNEPDPEPLQAVYAGDYLKEEVAAEGLVRRLPAFNEFLRLAAISDTELVNFSTFARDVGVSSQTIREYYQILEDTLIGSWIQPYQKRNKRRTRTSSKFYFFDTGVVNNLARRYPIQQKTSDFGKAFESWVMHELLCYKNYCNQSLEIRYWQLSSGTEVDFILNDLEVAIDVKAVNRINANHTKGLLELGKEHSVGRRIIVSLVEQDYKRDDGIEVISWKSFVKLLWNNDII